jgi:DNA ligase-1
MDAAELTSGNGSTTLDDTENNVIDPYQRPTTDSWWLPSLYNDKLVWQIGFDGEELVIRHGHIGGAIQVTTRKVLVNSSGRNLQEQALLEAKQRYWKQEHKGYTNGYTILPQYPKPMLANKYEPKKIKSFPVLVQAKIDGVRMLAHLAGNRVHLRSRENKEWDHLDHIREELAVLFSYLPVGCHLDGELYVHDWSFNTLISAVKTGQVTKSTKNRRDKHQLNRQVQYYIFDIIIPQPAKDRQELLDSAFQECQKDRPFSFLRIVPATLCYSHEELVQFHNCYVENGFEGAIIRHVQGSNRNGFDLTLYRDKRSDNLLKFKMFTDEEGEVVDIVEGTGTEEGLAMIVVRDSRGNIFSVRPRGTFDMRREWYLNRDQLIGKRYTFRYFELTEYNVPRFPIGIAFRDYE